MKYYEIHEPYYALLAAEDEKKAAEAYVEGVADDDDTLKDNIEEVGRDYAFGTFCWLAALRTPERAINEVIKEFEETKNNSLLIDGALE
ncbi:hypothetical protein NQS41_10045 [Bacillus sp. C3(2022)]|uniref:hypothetical protein n=1 Tax=Bacillus TaxID=1386 RepID=UPI0011A24100|nr:hypothetical protein [Bacillus licheniformis]TWJ94309.1 hypothetical protein CHCC20493_0469 [Bacillus licheniformis]TWL93749.1 hypothetical protein CHCC15292_4554 [Bacillus licheniformis]